MAIYPELEEQVLELAESLAVEEQEPPVAAVQAAAVHGALHLGVGPVQTSGMLGTDCHIR
jgi:hypothetical protein